jgi:hypothetical protein
VDLWVERPGGVLAEGGGNDPLRVDHGDLAVDAVAGVGMSFEPGGHGRDRGVVAGKHLSPGVGVAHGEQNRYRLRRRGGDVKASDRLLPVGPSELLFGPWIAAGHHGQEVVVGGLAVQAQQRGAPALPDAG